MEKKEYFREYYLKHKEELKEKQREYRRTKIGRASHLLRGYNRNDKMYNRGKGDLTPEWIVENIFSKPCAHCGETDWRKIGCNRLDNSLPHTKSNVEPCCAKCNHRLHADDIKGENNPFYGKFGKEHNRSKAIIQLTKDDKFVRRWENAYEVQRELGFSQGNISQCCNNKRKSAYDFHWMFESDYQQLLSDNKPVQLMLQFNETV